MIEYTYATSHIFVPSSKGKHDKHVKHTRDRLRRSTDRSHKTVYKPFVHKTDHRMATYPTDVAVVSVASKSSIRGSVVADDTDIDTDTVLGDKSGESESDELVADDGDEVADVEKSGEGDFFWVSSGGAAGPAAGLNKPREHSCTIFSVSKVKS